MAVHGAIGNGRNSSGTPAGAPEFDYECPPMHIRRPPPLSTATALCLGAIPTPVDARDQAAVQTIAMCAIKSDPPFTLHLVEDGFRHNARPSQPIIDKLTGYDFSLQIIALIGRFSFRN